MTDWHTYWMLYLQLAMTLTLIPIVGFAGAIAMLFLESARETKKNKNSEHRIL